MERLLFAEGPYAELADKLMLYGQFVGSWDVEDTEFRSGDVVERRGEWHFGWVLGGRGVQDVLFEKGAAADQRGTTIRCYDAAIDAWRVTWMGPGFGEFANLIGRPVGDTIVQEGAHDKGRFRWVFDEIGRDHFRWRALDSVDDGQTWTLVQQMRARRRRD